MFWKAWRNGCKEYVYRLFLFKGIFNVTVISIIRIMKIYKKIMSSYSTASIFLQKTPHSLLYYEMQDQLPPESWLIYESLWVQFKTGFVFLLSSKSWSQWHNLQLRKRLTTTTHLTPTAKTMKLHCKLKLASYCLLNEINGKTQMLCLEYEKFTFHALQCTCDLFAW